MLYSEFKERENRFILSLKILLPFIFIIFFAILSVVTKLDLNSLLKNNIIAFTLITFIYTYYILYQIYMGFKTSVIDNTTKAFSRNYILKIIDTKKKDSEFLVSLIKIKNIEDINERYGLKKTDKLLYLFVNRLNDFLEEQGYKNIEIGHIVGGSFLFLLKENSKKTNHLIRQFIKKVENEQINDIYLKLLYSYLPSETENSAEDLLVSLFEQLKFDEGERRNTKRLNIRVDEFEKMVVNLIEEREFDFRFQPVKNLSNDKIDIYEVLVKLNSKKYGKISQKQFISVVNRIGYELKFDEILIEEIFKIVSKKSIDKKISINISSFSIRNSRFLNIVKKLSNSFDTKNEQVIFEISGNNYLNDIIKLNENIKILKSNGFLIAIDNFGADNSSFKYIKNLNFDIVKFDIDYSKKYDQKIYEDILKTFINLFNELNVKTVIKFIDSEEKYKFFKELGVDYIQGFIVGKPTKEIR